MHPNSSLQSLSAARFGRLVSSVYRQWRRWIDLSIIHLDLTDATRMPLMALAEHEGPMRQNLLAETIALETTSMFRVLQQLKKRGLVTWVTDPCDRRAKLISLTTTGEDAAKQLLTESMNVENRILAEFTAEEIATTRRVLERITHHLQYNLPR